MPYSSVAELPPILHTETWAWEKFAPPDSPDWPRFWVGTDDAGNKWLSKMRGSFYGYRELIFERLVQHAGWLSQSSAFTVLPKNSPPIQTSNHAVERTQLLTLFLREHSHEYCGPTCLRRHCKGITNSTDPEIIEKLPLRDALNVARCNILAPLFGGNEPADFLLTDEHDVYLIDGEQMFATRPCDVRETTWWESDGGKRITRDICKTIGAFSDADLQHFLKVPAGIRIKRLWNIRDKVFGARDYAKEFALTIS